MQTNIQYNPEQWEARDSEFCPKYPELIGGTEDLIACLNHKETDAEVLITAGCLQDINSLIAYFVHTHKNTSNGYKSLLFIRSNAGYRINEDSIILQKEEPEPEPTRELRPAEVFDNLRRAGYKQFKGIFTYLSRGNKHCFQTTTNGYVMAEVNGTEVTPVMAFKTKKAIHSHFGI